jgi:exopolyphosphatase/guanosine-5'-triphosphate,3'-diphosphate pyrophosphatase
MTVWSLPSSLSSGFLVGCMAVRVVLFAISRACLWRPGCWYGKDMINLRSRATRLGVLDIGSNTVHMLIVDAAPGARPDAEASVKSTVRLMKYLKEDGSIKKSGVEAILGGVDQAMKLAEEYKITQLLPMATSAIREAPNGNKIIHRVEDRIGQRVTVLAGDDEARLTFLAARRWYGWDAGSLLMIDIGGGSLEVAMGSDEEPSVAASVPAGAGRITSEFLPEGMASPEELEDVRKHVRRILEPMVRKFPGSKYPNHAVGTSKTMRSLARLAGAVMRQPGRENTLIMTREQLEDWIPRLAAIAPEQRVALPGITPERTMQIVAGGVVADEVMKALNVNEVEICPWALREGAILRWLDQFGRTRLGF